MFHCEQDLLSNLIVLSPQNARRKFRHHIFEEWDWKCAYCNKELTERTATIDHIIPKYKSGRSVRSNLCCCCSLCNKDKASTDLSEWYTSNLSFYSEKRFVKLKRWIEQEKCSINILSSDQFKPGSTNELYVEWLPS